MKYIPLSLLLIILGCGGKPSETEKIFAACKKMERLSTLKHAPKQGDWLIEHPESYESVKAYLKKAPPQSDAKKSILYVVRIGNFDPRARQILDETKKYLHAFYQINVKELDPITINFLRNIHDRALSAFN